MGGEISTSTPLGSMETAFLTALQGTDIEMVVE
jgi:hypothetical protein